MMRDKVLLAATAIALAACGGGEPADEAPPAGAADTPAAQPPAAAAPSGEMTRPSWYMIDESARTVHMTITAGATNKQNYWNYNGATNGEMTITVPEGFTVTIDLVNSDPMMAHSLGITPQVGGYGASPQPDPAFPGAITSNPVSMTDATMPGEQESITFTAATAGSYAMACYIPGHAAVGMWVRFNVSGSGEGGVQGAPM